MGTREYLNGLTLEQLEFAKEEAERLIKDIRSQEKVGILVVSNSVCNVASFTEEQFHKAKVKLCEVIMSDMFTLGDVHCDHPRISRLKVYQSEVEEWMGLNT